MSEESMGPVEPPAQYNFRNWREFCQQALRYHESTRPDSQLVSDRIETIRKFMSPQAIEHLANLVYPEPSHRTTDGWDGWVASVRRSLRGLDPTVLELSVPLKGVLNRFKAGKMTEAEFWQELDDFVKDDEISSAEQRQLFWDALSWEAQDKYLRLSPYFDPQTEVWNTREPNTVETYEQNLAQIMEYAKMDDELAQRRSARKKFCFVGLMLIAIVAVSLAEMITDQDVSTKKFAFSVVLFMTCSGLAALNIVGLIYAWISINTMRLKQRTAVNSLV